MKVQSPGMYVMKERAYHADPAPEPSLSSSIAKRLVTRSPIHAWMRHPRLGGYPWTKTTKAMDVGTVVHDILLRGEGEAVVWVDAPDFRTKAAREARDSAYEAGMTPILEKDESKIGGIVHAAQQALKGDLDGLKERVFVWQEEDIWCRAMIDICEDGGASIIDVKTTDLAATPDGWARTQMWEYLFQAGFYRRAVSAHFGVTPTFKFVVIEMSRPNGVGVFELDEIGLELADRLADRAIEQWSFCSARGWERVHWRNYSEGVCRMMTPTWVIRHAKDMGISVHEEEFHERY